MSWKSIQSSVFNESIKFIWWNCWKSCEWVMKRASTSATRVDSRLHLQKYCHITYCILFPLDRQGVHEQYMGVHHKYQHVKVASIKPKAQLGGDSGYCIDARDIFHFSRSWQTNREQTGGRNCPGFVLFFQRTSQVKLFCYTNLLWKRSRASPLFTLESNKHQHGAQPIIPCHKFVVVQTALLIMSRIIYGDASARLFL